MNDDSQNERSFEGYFHLCSAAPSIRLSSVQTLVRAKTPAGEIVEASWFQHDFDTAIFLVTERLVHSGAVFERNGMRDHKGRVNLTFLNAL
ncbi:hypothetical protein AWB82_02787 [Caballeronia glebae]|uniref:Uncharacterized protein n=1 Tax=Caballeronia glebae TaxID=1777143 RepID=A0A158AQ69_9BURK|nr:hypothetical protein AWB82_02787 [Caballeronia glebae]